MISSMFKIFFRIHFQFWGGVDPNYILSLTILKGAGVIKKHPFCWGSSLMQIVLVILRDFPRKITDEVWVWCHFMTPVSSSEA